MCAAPVCSFAALPFAPVKDWRIACRTLVGWSQLCARAPKEFLAVVLSRQFSDTITLSKRRIPRKGRQMYLEKQLDSNPPENEKYD